MEHATVNEVARHGLENNVTCVFCRGSEFSLDGEHTGERQGLQERKGSLPPRHPGSLTPVSPPDRQFSLRDSLGRLHHAVLQHLCDRAWECLAGYACQLCAECLI